jgi:hypothetical protein
MLANRSAAVPSGKAVFGSVAPPSQQQQQQQQQQQPAVFLSPSSPQDGEAVSPRSLFFPSSSSSLSRGSADAVYLAEVEKSLGLMRVECDFLRDELLVKGQVAIVLGNMLVAAQAEAAQAKQDMTARIDLINQMQLEIHAQREELSALRHASASLERQVKERSEEAEKSAQAVASSAELTRLREEKQSLESQMSEWKTKVKEALREQKKREQQLTSSEIELRTELKSAQEKLSEAQFQLAGLQAKQNKVRTAREVQTDAVPLQSSFARGGLGSPVSGGGAIDVGSPMAVMGSGATGGNIQQRRRGYSKEIRSPSLQPMTAASVSGVRSPSHAAPPPLPLQTSSMVRSDQGALSTFAALYESFPLPISLNEAALLGLDPRAATLSPDNTGGGRDSPAVASQNAPDAPFIVSVHYSAEQDGGWSVVTKHRITVGMTTADLIEQCCEQCATRYKVTLLPDRVCIRLNHEHAKRKVTLSLPRKLHSFVYFRKCQKEGTPIVLYICPKDDLADVVNESMNITAATA